MTQPVKIVRNETCRMCEGVHFEPVIDLGEQPLVNSLVEKENLDKEDPVFPLVVEQCADCRLIQIRNIIDSEEIYRKVDYLFFSSDMPTLKEYFREYADEVRNRFLAPGDFVAEIGSNDGILLDLFPGYKVLGIDPSTNVVIRALWRGIPTVSDFFCGRVARSIVRDWGQAKVIMANNCIAHINDLRDVMEGAKMLLRDDGVMVIECNYWGGMVKNTNYSLIYHDHYSYFSLKVWEHFAPRYGMRVFDAVVTPAQGGSLRMFLCKDDRPETERLKALQREETGTQLDALETGRRYRENVWKSAEHLRQLMDDLKQGGKRIAGYGAAAKGFTILRCSGIDGRHIDYFVDDSPAKQGKYSPVSHIPIISRAEAEGQLPDYFIVLAPNYAKVIIEKEKEFRARGGKIIIPKTPLEIV